MSGFDCCTDACHRPVNCLTCGKVKRPVGRSVPLVFVPVYCGFDCDGWGDEPRAGHLWPTETPIKENT